MTSSATGNALIASEQISEPLIGKVVEFGRVLAAARFNITPGRTIDACRALPCVRIDDCNDFRLALRTSFASTREEQELFDQLFDSFWRPASGAQAAQSKAGLEPSSDDGAAESAMIRVRVDGSAQQYSRREVSRDNDLVNLWPGESAEMQRILRQLLRRLATRPSRRSNPSRRGRRVDLRRSLRKNLRYGMDLVVLSRLQRKTRKTRIVLLCDVSGSMDAYNPFLLQLMCALQKGLKNTRINVFSTKITDITPALRRTSAAQALIDVAALARHWSGGTHIGAALRHLNRTALQEAATRSTVAIIISDGYDQGDPAVIEREMRILQQRVRSVVWINPLLGTEGYAPLARGMRAALPYIDHFMPANDLRTLRQLCEQLSNL